MCHIMVYDIKQLRNFWQKNLYFFNLKNHRKCDDLTMNHTIHGNHTIIMQWSMATMPRNMAKVPLSWHDHGHVFPTQVNFQWKNIKSTITSIFVVILQKLEASPRRTKVLSFFLISCFHLYFNFLFVSYINFKFSKQNLTNLKIVQDSTGLLFLLKFWEIRRIAPLQKLCWLFRQNNDFFRTFHEYLN